MVKFTVTGPTALKLGTKLILIFTLTTLTLNQTISSPVPQSM